MQGTGVTSLAPSSSCLTSPPSVSLVCGVVWWGVVWCGEVWCGVMWCGVMWCDVMFMVV